MRWCWYVVAVAAWLTLAESGRLPAQDLAPSSAAPVGAAGEQLPGSAELEDLDWMVGDWVLEPEDDAETKQLGTMKMNVRWDDGRTFLIRDATLTPPADSGEPVVALHQRIGWDPLVDRIRSWSFSTDGSRGEATWFREGGSWIVRGMAVLPDGAETSSVNIYTFDGKDRCAWRVVRPALAADGALPARATWVRTPRSPAP
ncbi:MAG: hypothetical protein ACKOB1_02855 [Planctomycetia bacterium]